MNILIKNYKLSNQSEPDLHTNFATDSNDFKLNSAMTVSSR